MADGVDCPVQGLDLTVSIPAKETDMPMSSCSKDSETKQWATWKKDDTSESQVDGGSINKSADTVNAEAVDGATGTTKGEQYKDGDEVKSGRPGSGWGRSDQGRKAANQHTERPPGRFSKQSRQEAAEAKAALKAEAAKGGAVKSPPGDGDEDNKGDTAKDEGSSSQQQPKGKRYERDRRESWRGRNERRSQQQGGQQNYNDKGKDHTHSDGGDNPDFKDEDKHDNQNSSQEYNNKNKNGSSNHNRNDSSRKDIKEKAPFKSKSDSSQPTAGTRSEGAGRGTSDQSAKGDTKEGRDRGSKQPAKDTRHGSGRGGGGRNQSSRSGQGDSYQGEGRSKDKAAESNKARKDSGGSDRGRKNSDRDSDPGQLNIASGADLLSLLNQSTTKPSSGRTRERREGKGKNTKLPSAADLEAKWQKEEEQKRKKEEEARQREEERLKKEEEERLAEEERKRQEEELKRKEEEEARRLEEEEKQTIKEYISEARERIALKASMRLKNLNAAEHRPDESFFSQLDSSLRKNTAFVKRLRNLTELQKDSLVKDLNSLNLSKYIGEAAAAITEAKLKMSDINCGLHICSLLHQRYTDFSTALMESWQKTLPNKKEDKQSFNASKLRVDLRFFAEVVSVGVFTAREGLPLLANQLTMLLSADKEDNNNLSVVLSFGKHCGDDYAGLIARKYRLLAEKYEFELVHSQFLPKERQRACRNLLKEYFASLTKHLMRDHKELKMMEKLNLKILQTKGELNTERKDHYEAAQQAFYKLYANTAAFADVLDEDTPDLPEDDLKTDADGMGLDIFNPLKNAEYQYEGDTSLFEDDEMRTFYENLPDLKAFIPGILYKDSEQAAPAVPLDTANGAALEDGLEVLDLEDIDKEITDLEEAGLTGKMDSDKEKNNKESSQKEEEFVADDLLPEIEDDDCDIASSMKLIMEGFLASLPNCVNRELIDKAAIDFCMNLNTKANRRKLVRGLFSVQRTRYDLLPFYSRLVATLHPCMPDVATDLTFFLKSDFRWHVRKKDQINIESKLKTVRFIGELVKFGMFPQSEALHCMKMLLHDFTHHNIEMACALLETAGRYLYRSPDSHHRTKVYLDVMMRKKAALHLDSRYSTMIENAYYYSNPPDVKSEVRKIRPPMHEYLRKLLYKDLSKITTEKVLRQMRKVDWDDSEIMTYITKCLTRIWNVRYNSIHCVANLLAGLAPYHEHVAIQVVDGILEEIRLGMEINIPKYNQRRVCAVKFLGELYNYRMVESGVIFKALYSFISFGVTMDEEEPSLLDPPEHLFRIRLVCVVLDTCGQYFDRGSSKKKLDCFITYFQKYYWFKRSASSWTEERPFPMDVEYLMRDILEALRPKLKLSESYSEANEATDLLDQEFRARLAEVLPLYETEDTEDEELNDSRLPAIRENEETDELSQGLSQLAITGDDHSTQDSELGGEDQTGSQSQTASTGHLSGDGHEVRARNRPRDEGEEGQHPVEPDIDDENNEDDELLESAGEDEEDDQVTVLTGGLKYVKSAEDDDFMTAFDKMMADHIQARSHEATKVPQVDIAVPMHLKGQKQKAGLVPSIHGVALAPPSPPPEEPAKHINFVLMTKRGNRQQFTTLNVPISAEFATKFREREEAERAEKERMKRVVLDIHERQEEEDYQEMLAAMSRPAPANMNRERRVRYQHPKGAPDADLIFGSKER